MGQIKAQLQEEITIAEVVRDIAANSGDTEKDSLRWIALEIIDAEIRDKEHESPFYCKVTITLPPLQRGARTGTVTSRDPISMHALSTRLLEAARDGWDNVRPITCERGEVNARDVLVRKDWIIHRLRQEQVDIPSRWLGKAADVANKTGKSNVGGTTGLRLPQKPDVWAHAICATYEDMLGDTSQHPNKAEVWLRMSAQPPTNYPITVTKDRGLDALKMPGEKPLTQNAFAKRWKRYQAAK